MNAVLYELLHKYRNELNQPLNDIKDECWENIIDSVIAKEVIDDFLLLFKTEKTFLPSKFIEMPHNIKLEATLMPPYLKTVHFVAWLRKFNQLINEIGLPEWNFSNADISIKFSNEEKTKIYGTMSLNEVKAEIERKWKLNERAKKILERIKDVDTYYNEEIASPLAEEIHCANREYPYDVIRAELDELFGKVYFKARILGEYYHQSKTIVLYAKSIECTGIPGRNVVQSFEVTFIHELFHAYHYRNNGSEIISRHDYTNTVVKESLAAAFEWGYCVKNTISGDLDLRRVWEKHSVLAYPYSGAQALTDQHKRVLKATEFCDIFKESLLDMDKALRDMLPLVDFYNIKNLIVSDIRKAFDSVMKMDKIGVIAQREIPVIIKNNKVLREKLHDKAYCQNTFNISYAVLSPTRQFLSNKYRYYEDPIIVDKKEYFLCSQWDKKHLTRLLDWLWANR